MPISFGFTKSSIFKTRPWQPTDISGILTWYKADVGVLDANDNKVSSNNTQIKTWQDQSGNNNHLVQTTAASQGLYKTSQQNGLPAVQFDGSNDFYVTTNRLTTARTVFIVHKWSVTNDDWRPILGDSITYNFHGGAANGTLFYTSDGASTLETRFVYLGSQYVNGVLTAPNATARYTTCKLVSVVTTANCCFDQISKDRTFSERQFSGQMHEIIAYDTALSNTDRQKVENYLLARWGI